MVLATPFLLLMKRTNSEHHYFALWVGNPSLLVGPLRVEDELEMRDSVQTESPIS